MKIILVLLVGFLLNGCSEPLVEYPHKYRDGQVLCMKIDGRPAMVLSRRQYSQVLTVRLKDYGEPSFVQERELEECGEDYSQQ